MVVRGGFEGETSRLFVASRIAGYEENGDTFDLRGELA